LALAEEDQCYQALKFARRVMRHEEVVLGLTPIAQFATTAE
jgi:flagellar protein FlbT